MKRKLFTIALLVSLFAGTAKAQTTLTTSTQAQPVWYHMGVTDGSGSLLVCTVEDNEVHARAEAAPGDAAFDHQLWRFEQDGDKGTVVVNKATGTYLNFKYNSTLAVTKACVDEKPAYFTLTAKAGGWIVKATTTGIRDACYLGLTTNASLDNAMEELASEPAPIAITIYNDKPFKESTAGAEYWYNIVPAATGATGLAMRDNSAADKKYPLALSTLQEGDYTQQWMFVRHADTGLYEIVNRKNTLHILTQSVIQDLYNAAQIGWNDANPGFKVDYIGLGQYSLSSVESDGIERMLSAQKTGADVNSYDGGTLLSSPFAWTLHEAGFSTGIDNAAIEAQVKVKDGKIVVPAGQDYTIFNAIGMAMPKDTKLQKGVYVIVIGNHSVKVIIK